MVGLEDLEVELVVLNLVLAEVTTLRRRNRGGGSRQGGTAESDPKPIASYLFLRPVSCPGCLLQLTIFSTYGRGAAIPATDVPAVFSVLLDFAKQCARSTSSCRYSGFWRSRTATTPRSSPRRFWCWTTRGRTPAHVRNDGHNYHPTNRWVLFGHHFAAITGAGPLIGPVLAAQFGFRPGPDLARRRRLPRRRRARLR